MLRFRQTIGQAANQIAYEDFDSYSQDALQRLIDDVIDRAVKGAPWPLIMKLSGNISSASSGVFNIPSAIAIQSIPSPGEVLANGGGGSGLPLQFVEDIELLKIGGFSDIWEYYTITGAGSVGGAILTYKGDGSVFNPTTINIRAAVFPVLPTNAVDPITDLPVTLENDYIDKLVEVAREKMAGPQAAGQNG